MEKVKQKDILKVLNPYVIGVVTKEQGIRQIKLDDFFIVCLNNYKNHVNAVNVSYFKKK